MASLEMLKKLLDEFAEKEAHTREEINVVTQQIVELEQRAEAARVRQQGIAGDRERLMEMKAHYAGGAITQRAGGAVAAAAPAAGGIPLPVQTPQAIPAAVMPPAPPAPAPQPLTQSISQSMPTLPQAAAPVEAAPAPAAPKANRFDLLDLFSPNEEPAPAPAAVEPAPAPVAQPAPAAAVEQPAAQPAPAPAAESPKEEEDDTVKSINDALRGLFR